MTVAYDHVWINGITDYNNTGQDFDGSNESYTKVEVKLENETNNFHCEKFGKQ